MLVSQAQHFMGFDGWANCSICSIACMILAQCKNGRCDCWVMHIFCLTLLNPSFYLRIEYPSVSNATPPSHPWSPHVSCILVHFTTRLLLKCKSKGSRCFKPAAAIIALLQQQLLLLLNNRSIVLCQINRTTLAIPTNRAIYLQPCASFKRLGTGVI